MELDIMKINRKSEFDSWIAQKALYEDCTYLRFFIFNQLLCFKFSYSELLKHYFNNLAQRISIK
jgi:hypothetical protein